MNKKYYSIPSDSTEIDNLSMLFPNPRDWSQKLFNKLEEDGYIETVKIGEYEFQVIVDEDMDPGEVVLVGAHNIARLIVGEKDR